MAGSRSGYACMRKCVRENFFAVAAGLACERLPVTCRKQACGFGHTCQSPLPSGERARVRGGCSRQPPLAFATWLACGGLSAAFRRPSYFSLLAHATARSGGERRSRPAGRRAGCPESREVTKRNGLVQSAGTTIRLCRGLGERSHLCDRRCSHSAPHLETEGMDAPVPVAQT